MYICIYVYIYISIYVCLSFQMNSHFLLIILRSSCFESHYSIKVMILIFLTIDIYSMDVHTAYRESILTVKIKLQTNST